MIIHLHGRGCEDLFHLLDLWSFLDAVKEMSGGDNVRNGRIKDATGLFELFCELPV